MVKPEDGGFEVKPTQNGLLLTQIPSYGSMENVSGLRMSSFLKLMVTTASAAGAGKSVISYDVFQHS